nr:immunoglobulin light chain junction region [Macaca mulatta]
DNYCMIWHNYAYWVF